MQKKTFKEVDDKVNSLYKSANYWGHRVPGNNTGYGEKDILVDGTLIWGIRGGTVQYNTVTGELLIKRTFKPVKVIWEGK